VFNNAFRIACPFSIAQLLLPRYVERVSPKCRDSMAGAERKVNPENEMCHSDKCLGSGCGKGIETNFRVVAFRSVRKYAPQSDHVERSDLAKRFFIAGLGEGDSQEPRQRGREERRGLNTPQQDSA
jgi:hypothetical protein